MLFRCIMIPVSIDAHRKNRCSFNEESVENQEGLCYNRSLIMNCEGVNAIKK